MTVTKASRQPSGKSVYEKYITVFREHNMLNADISVADADKVFFHQKIGFADIENQYPFSDDMLFPIASLTKQFTAVAVLMLHQLKLCDLHCPIIHYLNEKHPIWQGKVPLWINEVTLHHLLTHTSGIENYTELPCNDLDTVGDQLILTAILSKVIEKPLRFTPGKKFEYNNTGYLLLSVIVAELSAEKNFSEFLSRHLFQPLAMHHTFLPSIAQERKLMREINQDKNFLKRYTANLAEPGVKPMLVNHLRFKAPLVGGAGMISTRADLLKWHQGLYQGCLLNRTSLDLMTTSHIQNEDPLLGPIKYGYGIFINDNDKNNIIYEHGGWVEGIRTELSYSPKMQRTVIILSNVSPNEDQSESAQNQQAKQLHQLAQQLQ